MNQLNQIRKSLNKFQIENMSNGFHLTYRGEKSKDIILKVKMEKLILPAREGEFIKDINCLPTNFCYKLTYPGTASTKCMVLYTSDKEGIFIGGKPTTEYAQMTFRRNGADRLEIIIRSTENDLLFLPFRGDWKKKIKIYKKFYNLDVEKKEKKVQEPRYQLQMGIKNPLGYSFIKDFNDLREPIDYFHKRLGDGHIIHFFGANQAGFDRMYPRLEIATDLGGEKSLEELLSYIKKLHLLSSHHFNPRIADYEWIKKNPEYKTAIIRDDTDTPIVELYKGHPFYVMNPNDKKWFDICLKTIKRLHNLGFDYIQLDQFTYQRNFYIRNKPIQDGYLKMVKEVCNNKINIWLEGVGDLFHLNGKDHSQILVRDRPQFWGDFELRRGYPYGCSYPDFYMNLYPESNISYQVMTENKSVKSFKKKLCIAKKIKAMVYDLQMDFYNEEYMDLLKDVVQKILNNNQGNI